MSSLAGLGLWAQPLAYTPNAAEQAQGEGAVGARRQGSPLLLGELRLVLLVPGRERGRIALGPAPDPLTRPDKLTVLPVSTLLAETIMNVFAHDSVSAIFGGENQLF